MRLLRHVAQSAREELLSCLPWPPPNQPLPWLWAWCHGCPAPRGAWPAWLSQHTEHMRQLLLPSPTHLSVLTLPPSSLFADARLVLRADSSRDPGGQGRDSSLRHPTQGHRGLAHALPQIEAGGTADTAQQRLLVRQASKGKR